MTSPATAPRRRDPRSVAERLLRASARHAAGDGQDIDWTTPPVADAWFLPPERISLYGTDLWERMDERQRLALSRAEWARMTAVGIWAEQILVQRLAQYALRRDVADLRARYALTEAGDETRHIAMFGRQLEEFGCHGYGPSKGSRRLASVASSLCGDIATFAGALIFEEVTDRYQREMMRDARVQPLVRRTSHVHVVEEARHVGFAYSELSYALRKVSAPQLARERWRLLCQASVLAHNLRVPTVYRAAGLDPAQAAREARHNPHHRETVIWSAEKAVTWFTGAGLIGRRERPLWRRVGLLR